MAKKVKRIPFNFPNPRYLFTNFLKISRKTPCFIGNLYKQVKDPNLVGALSGHKEGSRAFARYREIDEDMKRDLVSVLE